MTAQHDASDPRASAWVAASAGTGKTFVLTDRVLRLLLAGAPVGRLLCLTFTKAASAEIANRVHQRLGEWAILPEAGLVAALTGLSGRAPEADEIERARRLFARVLDAPDGLKVKTIHAFCESLLARFPLEAGLAPHFSVMDERTTAELLGAARDEVLARARRGGDPELAAALAEVTSHLGEQRFAELIGDVTSARGRLRWVGARARGPDGPAAATRGALGLAPHEDRPSALGAACHDPSIDGRGLSAAAEAMRRGGAQDRAHGATIAHWLSEPAARGAGLDEYFGAFFKDHGAGDRFRSLIHKVALDLAPGADAVLAREAERLDRVRDRLKRLQVYAATQALLTLGEALIGAYAAAKARHALLDYDDLILRARDLLRGDGLAPWVLYKLDGGLDHILIDEAQDTSPEQWQVIAALADEFFAGVGARAGGRTVFAVGDAKQSIFSFQGADPSGFARWRDTFARRVREAGQDWRPVALERSFRSAQPVLMGVDRVFASATARDGVLLDGGAVHHVPEREGQAGLVELWPATTGKTAPAPAAWSPPVAAVPSHSPSAELAGDIATRIVAWLESGERLPSRGRPIRPGDILILVQRRSGFVEDMVRALKARDVPVAGIDRMILTEQLAVMDLMALGRFVLLPDDDLTLAVVLKSPLVGFDDAALFDLAHGRERSLWRTLVARADERTLFGRSHEWLAGLLARADYTPPFEFFAEVLGAGEGRRKLHARLGAQVNDPIDEFLALALAFERDHVPSLQGFLHWLDAQPAEIVRDMEQGRDEVRVMTVHGAKGLEAPIVFLPDTCRTPGADERLLWLGEHEAALLWPPRRDMEDAVSRRARDEARRRRDQEYRRLLYVAMTRAEDRLYVCGWRAQPKLDPGCWYNLIESGLAGVAERVTLADGRPGLRLAARQEAAPDKAEPAGVEAPAETPLPAWAGREPAREPAPASPLAPSRPEIDGAPSSPDEDTAERRRRGRLVHALLQALPSLPGDGRAPAARRILAERAPELSAPARAAIVAEVLGVLAHPDFSVLFGPHSRAEVAITGQVGERTISGRIDRLAVTAHEVFLVDFKTGRAPLAARDVAPSHLAQMSAYRAALSEIYPGKTMRCALIWTEGPALIPLPESMLDIAPP